MDHDDDRTIRVRATWSTDHEIEVPDHVSTSEARDEIRDGGLPAWAAAQMDASTAALTDWEVA